MKTGTAARRLTALLVVGLVVAASGCGRYPPVSREAFELSKAVFNVCNARRSEQLDTARETVLARRDAGRISQREGRYLCDILDLAEAGNWKRAEARAQRLLRDQTQW